MALPGHSPSHSFSGPGSPPRILNGHLDNQHPHSAYGHRSMLPPSPQHYHPRMPHMSNHTPSPSLPPLAELRGPPPPYKRPGSSMSISAMLGGEPEKPVHEPYNNSNPITRTSSRQPTMPAPPMHANSAMSPPQQPLKSAFGDYSYKPRSQTPEQIGASYSMGPNRQRSSSSGTMMQRPSNFNEPPNPYNSSAPRPSYGDQAHGPSSWNIMNTMNEDDGRIRRTSLSGILQRPSSQPQFAVHGSPIAESPKPVPLLQSANDRHMQPDGRLIDAQRQNGHIGTYDTRPPGMNGVSRPSNFAPSSPPKPPPLMDSTQQRRDSLNGTQNRGLASILNEPSHQPPDVQSSMSQNMARQDSAQSQNERSFLNERNKFRQFSPFPNITNPQGHPASTLSEEPNRKGSDELSQHRIILGIAAENKRGRFSPLPQAVLGAQPQTPVPEAAIRTEHGRIFSGIGSGVSNMPLSSSVSASPFKKDEGGMRLSEDNLAKVSRNPSGTGKRARKGQEEEGQIDGERNNGEKARVSKKGKYQHEYTTEMEESLGSTLQRRNTPASAPSQAKRASNLMHANLNGSHSAHSTSQRQTDTSSIFKPKRTIKLLSVINAASRNHRRHLGNFIYRPNISCPDSTRPNTHRFDISITPNLVPSFTASEHVNCTYTIRVPRMWLQARERGLICAEQFLWGSGIYTDDSDPVAAAIHAGFIKTSLGEMVDAKLLARIIKEQNPRIDFPQEIKPPSQPMDIIPDKDLNITLLVLPVLERYESSARFGVRSRTWPGGGQHTEHDGVSFSVLKVEFASIGAEEIRVGRTGKERRDRLRLDLEARRRDFEIEKERIKIINARKTEQRKLQKSSQAKIIPRSVGATSTSALAIKPSTAVSVDLINTADQQVPKMASAAA